MLSKEILGIFLGDHSIDYFLLKRTPGGWKKGNLAVFSSPGGKNSLERLHHLLSHIRPKRGRKIVILIPRTRYFLRDLEFKGLSHEEAESAVRLSVGIHAHLPEEEIIYDCNAFSKNGQTHVLLCYSRRSYIESIIEQLDRTGHKKALFCISPVGLGVDQLLRMSASTGFPVLSIYKEDESYVVNLHGKTCWQGCLALDSLSGQLIEEYDVISKVALFDLPDIDPFPNKEKIDPKTGINERIFKENFNKNGFLAAILGTSSYPQLSLKPGIRKKPLLSRIDAYQIAFLGLIVTLTLFSLKSFFDYSRLGTVYERNKNEVTRILKEYEPLKQKELRLKKIQALIKDIQDFSSEKPTLLEILRDISLRTPDDAWIKYLTVRRDKVRISAEGGYAVKTIEAWRKSPYFTDVKLASPVTKNREGQERYTVEMRLRLKK